MAQQIQQVLDFWFDQKNQPYWFAKSEEFDQQIRLKFSELWQAVVNNQCLLWRDSIYGRLAEIIVLDQFSRNLHRDSPLAFAQDERALQLARESVQLAAYAELNLQQRQFLLLPYMHSESQAVQAEGLPLFAALNNPLVLDFAEQHKVIIDRFGRFPHRNFVLNRESSAEEQAFLQQPGSSF
ncbi:DUF924 family protein [Testudinibacter aquarius]|uniref:DUF924 domain-containing protein n=1 Tax=Testudinibacter aquarius TaxID=1524974 RepID=A0A4R3YA28_9PAST|nr:DUF924 family protein [Testudinibacter aquarius]KAE9528315.1 hypothetical protein A1D24_09965 [Testudinibacter aquarius]TCV88847.1 uncharacterized protein (DUF924 family) [Testudinibacter aquarius]TNG93415.1 DUF924 domain-containing protein [Testudinibacter aquarius]